MGGCKVWLIGLEEWCVRSLAEIKPCAPAQALTRRSMSAKRRSLPASALNAFALKMALELPMLTSHATPALCSSYCKKCHKRSCA